MGPAGAAHLGEYVTETAGAHPDAVEFKKLARKRFASVEIVAAANVVFTEVPVEVPDPIPPAQDLTHHCFDTLQRSVAAVVRLDNSVDNLLWMQQPEVHRHTQTGMAHLAVAEQGGILKRAEIGQSCLNEVGESRERFGTGGRKLTWAIVTDELGAAFGLHSVEVASHLRIDLVFYRPISLRQPQAHRIFGWRLAIVVIEVEAPTLRLETVHEHPCRSSTLAIVLIHQQPLATASLSPALKVRFRSYESAAGQDGSAQLLDQPPRPPRGWVDYFERAAGEHVAVVLCREVLDPIAELGGPVTQSAQNEVRFSPVIRAPRQHRLCLDEHDRPAVVEVRAELVGEQKAGHCHEQKSKQMRGLNWLKGIDVNSASDEQKGAAVRAALAAPNSSARLQAALTAGTSPDPAYVGALVEASGIDADFFVRDMLTWALTRHASEHTVPLLLDELRSPVGQARSQALHTLSKIGDRTAWPAITSDLLHDPDISVARAAWRAAVLLAPDDEKAALALELSKELGRGDRATRLGLTRALIDLGETVPAVLQRATLSDNPAVVAHAVATQTSWNEAQAD